MRKRFVRMVLWLTIFSSNARETCFTCGMFRPRRQPHRSLSDAKLYRWRSKALGLNVVETDSVKIVLNR